MANTSTPKRRFLAFAMTSPGTFLAPDHTLAEYPEAHAFGTKASERPPASPSVASQPTPDRQEQFSGKVVGIANGDTLSVLRDGKAVKVRLHGIDTPERKQAFGTQARQYTSELAFGQAVTVKVRDVDRYGHLVGEVMLPGGRSLNHALVKAGMAWWYRQYAKGDATLAELEAEAKAAKRGLWRDPHATAPWAWRRQGRR